MCVTGLRKFKVYTQQLQTANVALHGEQEPEKPRKCTRTLRMVRKICHFTAVARIWE